MDLLDAQTQDPSEGDLLNLSEEELDQLRADGVIPADWQPNATGYEEEDPGADAGGLDGLGAEEGETPDEELPYELGKPFDLNNAQAPHTVVEGGMDLLKRYESESPAIQDPALKRFSDIALSWLPTDDKELVKARADAQRSADQLAQLRQAADAQAQGYPWDVFAAEMFSPKMPYGYSAAMGTAMKAVNAERARREKIARDLGVTEAQALATQANRAEAGQISRVRAAADLTQAAAQMQRYQNAFSKTATTGAFGKKMADLGIDITTPEGKKAARRMFVLEQAKSDPAALQTLLTNPDMDPFSPEFAEAVAKAQLGKLGAKEAEAKAKETRAQAKEDRSAKAAAVSLQAAELQMKRVRQLMAQAQKGGISGGKVPAEIQRQQLAIRALDSGLDVYEDALKGVDPRSWDQMDSRKQARIKSILADLIISWKEAAALGALSGPDVGMIERALTDPFSVKGAWYGKGGLSEQLTQARGAIARRAKTIQDQYGADMGDVGNRGAPAPAAAAGGNEVRRKTSTGRVGIFDAASKKFIRWE